MTEFVVCYEIPQKPLTEDIIRTMELGGQTVSREYQKIYDKLDEIGYRILTSTYLVQWTEEAEDLLNHILTGLPNTLKDKIKFFISEVSPTNSTKFPL